MLSISSRAKNTPFSPIRKLLPLARQAEKKGISVFRLNIGQPDFPTPLAIKSRLKKFNENLTYAPSEGIEKAQKAWQKYYQKHKIKVDLKDIIITTGGSEAIVFAMAVAADIGDEIITFEPFYANYKSYAKLVGINLVPITLSVKNGFRLPDAKKIISRISKKTRAILVCNPSNPTGAVLTEKEIKMLVKIAKEKNLFILTDEVYREFVLNGKKHFSFMQFPEIKDRVILLDSISKRFNACGARIGAIVSKNSEVMQNALKFAQARLSVATAEQMAAIPLLLNPLPYTKKLISQYQKRRDVVYNALQKIPGVICHKPEGAFYVIAALPIDDSEKFCRWMLEKFSYKKQTLLVAPARDFYMSEKLGKNEVRIAYVLNEKKLTRAMELLKRGIMKYNSYRLQVTS